MRYLLDTCVLSEMVRVAPDVRVVSWLEAQDESELGISVLTLGELLRGAMRLAAGGRRKRIEAWIREDVTARFGSRCVGVDVAVVTAWARLQARTEAAGRVLPTMDGLIAATALAHDAALVTRNVKDFVVAGVEVLNPWEA